MRKLPRLFPGRALALASSGAFFLSSIPGARGAVAELKIVGSHGDAIEAVKKGEADIAIVKKLMETILAMKSDPAPEAAAVRRDLFIQGSILTSAADFRHTLGLLRRAAFGPDFDFK